MYYLAQAARTKLATSAAQGDHDLRIIVAHANLVDTLVSHLYSSIEKNHCDTAAAIQIPILDGAGVWKNIQRLELDLTLRNNCNSCYPGEEADGIPLDAVAMAGKVRGKERDGSVVTVVEVGTGD